MRNRDIERVAKKLFERFSPWAKTDMGWDNMQQSIQNKYRAIARWHLEKIAKIKEKRNALP